MRKITVFAAVVSALCLGANVYFIFQPGSNGLSIVGALFAAISLFYLLRTIWLANPVRQLQTRLNPKPLEIPVQLIVYDTLLAKAITVNITHYPGVITHENICLRVPGDRRPGRRKGDPPGAPGPRKSLRGGIDRAGVYKSQSFRGVIPTKKRQMRGKNAGRWIELPDGRTGILYNRDVKLGLEKLPVYVSTIVAQGDLFAEPNKKLRPEDFQVSKILVDPKDIKVIGFID